VGPNAAFLLLIFGVLGIYCEFIWPGRVIPGVAGAAAALAGAFFLFRGPLQVSGLVLLAAGIVLLAAETLAGPYYLLGSFGSIALTAGFALLLSSPRRLSMILAIPMAAVLGGVTTFLAAAAKRARRNKWSDIAED
jgi:membrane-bound serine protease (ClpP class)